MTLDNCLTALEASYAAEVERRGIGYTSSDNLKRELNEIAQFLIEGKKSGLYICGLCGNGKTTMVRAIVSLVSMLLTYDDKFIDCAGNIQYVTAKDIINDCSIKLESIKQYSKMKYLAIDDLGCEPVEIKQYGNVNSPIVDILSDRYEDQLFTIITTNLKPSEIAERYGQRIADRFREMMQKVNFKDETFRK